MMLAAAILLCMAIVSVAMGAYVSGVGFLVAALIMFIRARGAKKRGQYP